MTGALVSTGRAALLTFLLRLLQARTAELAVELAAAELAEEDEELAAAEDEVDEADDEDELAAAEDEDEADDEVEEADEDEEEDAEVAATANELVLLLDATDDDDLEVEVEEVVGLTEVELVVGLTEVEILLSEGVSVLVEEVDVDEAAAEDDEREVEFVGAAEDCEDDEREAEEDCEEDDDEREVEEDEGEDEGEKEVERDGVEDAAALGAEKEDERVRDEEVEEIEKVRDEGEDEGYEDDDSDSSDEDDDRAAELSLDDAEVAAAARLTLDVFEDKILKTLLLMLLLLNKAELLIDGAELLTLDELLTTDELLTADELLTTDELLATNELLAAAALLLDEAKVGEADALELELDRELDDGEPIDKDSATCEEVAAAGVDVLRGLEDKRVTDEEVEDGFTDEEVEDGFTDVELAFDEVLLAFTEEDEVEVGFCLYVRKMCIQGLFNFSYLGARAGRSDLCAAARDNSLA
jgi:hypothetical protein